MTLRLSNYWGTLPPENQSIALSSFAGLWLFFEAAVWQRLDEETKGVALHSLFGLFYEPPTIWGSLVLNLTKKTKVALAEVITS